MKAEVLHKLSGNLRNAFLHTPEFAKDYFPKRFTRPFVSAHDEYFAMLDDDSSRKTCIAAPRGWGKTTIDTIALPARKICFRENKFIVILSATHDMAARNVRNLGRELTDNPRIVNMFGNLKGKIWSEGRGHLETAREGDDDGSQITILAKGAGQQIRGLLEQERRPDLIIVDDLEDPEPFRKGTWEPYLAALKEWFFADLMGAIDVQRTRIVVVGTILHENSLLQQLLDSPEWNSMRLELCDDNYRSNFPDYMDDDKVRELAQEFASKGLLDTFFREYRNIPISSQDAIFKGEYFKYTGEDDIPSAEKIINDPFVAKAIIVDPAKTVKVHSAHTAIVGVGIDTVRNRIYFLDCVNDKLHPEQIYEESWLMARRLKTHNIAVEVTSLSNFITYPFNAFLKLKGFPAVIEVHADKNKAERIKQLAPFYRLGCVYHNKKKSEALEAQLKTFDRSKYWDVMDAFAYCIRLFDIGEMTFGLPDEEDEAAYEAEIAELDRLDGAESSIEDGWQCAP